MTALMHFTEEPNSCQMAVSRTVPILQVSYAEQDFSTGTDLNCKVLPTPSQTAQVTCIAHLSLESMMKNDTNYSPPGLHWLTCQI